MSAAGRLRNHSMSAHDRVVWSIVVSPKAQDMGPEAQHLGFSTRCFNKQLYGADPIAMAQKTTEQADAAALAGTLTTSQRAMVERHIPLVEHITTRVLSRLPASHERDDLVQTGLLGLIAAVQRFDPDAGTAFSTYAGRRIEGAIIDHLRRADWAPRSVRSLERRVRSVEEALPPTADRPERVAEALGVAPDDLARLRADLARARVDSLDRPVNDTDEVGTVGGTVASSNPEIEHLMEDKELAGYVRSAVDLLPERHRIVVMGYFFEDRSMTELGELLGVTQSRASQLKDEALRMMRGGLARSYDETEPVPASLKQATRRQRAFNEALSGPRPWHERLASDSA